MKPKPKSNPYFQTRYKLQLRLKMKLKWKLNPHSWQKSQPLMKMKNTKTTMKKAQTVLNFINDTITFQGHQIKLNVTSKGLYYLRITEPKSLINNTKTNNKDQITLRVAKSNTIAHKLHWTFAYPSADELLKLLKNAGGQWVARWNQKYHWKMPSL